MSTPMERVRCVSSVSKEMIKCINAFWKGVRIDRSKLTIDGDQHLMLYIYIATKARLPELFAHVKMAKEFVTPTVRNTRYGYCLSTLEVALFHILEMDISELQTWQIEENSKSKSKSIRASVALSNRTSSLRIPEDPLE